MKKIWFITGVSRGFGAALKTAVEAAGDEVIGTTRSAGPWQLDVTNRAQVFDVVQRAHAVHGRLDVIVNNAGYGLLGAVEEIDEAAARAVMDTNFFGALWVTQAALPLLRAQKSGHIVNITSIAGVAASPAGGLYAASKFALEGMTMSLALETKPLGIHVTLVEPGLFRTEFLSERSVKANAPSSADYADTAGAAIARLASVAGKQPGSPEKAVAAIIKVVAAAKPPLHLLLGSDALRRTRETHAAFAADIAAWESTTTGTDY